MITADLIARGPGKKFTGRSACEPWSIWPGPTVIGWNSKLTTGCEIASRGRLKNVQKVKNFSVFDLSGLSTLLFFAFWTFRFSGDFSAFRDFSTFQDFSIFRLFVFLFTFRLFRTFRLFGTSRLFVFLFTFRLFGTFRFFDFSFFW